jgi:hypothetical protein
MHNKEIKKIVLFENFVDKFDNKGDNPIENVCSQYSQSGMEVELYWEKF